jgi:hypothetical protein
MKPEELILHCPVKPMRIVQVYGASPEYYARFKDRFGNPETGHMGIDLQAYHGQPVYPQCTTANEAPVNLGAKLGIMKVEDPLNLAGRSVYLPDISPEELERHIAADTRKAILDEEDEQARITRLLR